MSKVFRWLLLAATNGGKRYIRALLNIVAYLTSKVTTAPGATMKAMGTVEMPRGKATVVSRAVSDIRHKGLAKSVRMAARMITKLVSTPVFKGKTEVVTLLAALSRAAGSVMRGVYRAAVGLAASGEACSGSIIATSHGCEIGLESGLKTSPLVEMAAELETTGEVYARVTAEEAISFPADMEAEQRLLANVKVSPAADLSAPSQAEIGLKAQLITWVAPAVIGENTLYIPQVYEAELDGNTLILK